MASRIPESLRHVIDRAPYAVALLDQEMQYLGASCKWIKDFRLDHDLCGRSHMEIFPLMDKGWKAVYEDALKGRSSKSEHDEVVFLDGNMKWLSWEVQSWTDDAGEMGGLILYMDIRTEEQEQVEALQRKLEIYERTNEIAGIGVWQVDLITNELYWSPITRQIHGVADDYKPRLDEAVGFFKEGESIEIVRMFFRRAIETGEGYSAEIQLVNAKNEEIWVRTIGNAEFMNGACIRVYGTFQNIQQEKLQAIQLANSEIKYRSIVENSLYAFLQTIPGKMVVEANQAAMDMFGYTLEEFRQISRYGLMDKDDPRLHEFVAARERDGKAIAEMTAIRKNGEHFPCEMSSSIYLDIEGNKTNSLVIIDISERKRAEEQIRMSEEQFRGAFEYSAIGMALFTIDGRCKKANQSLCDMLGYTEAELVQLGFEDITHPDDLPRNIELLKKLTDGISDSYHMEKRYLHKSGRSVWVLLGVSILRDAEGDPIHFISQIQDITDHKKAENLVSEERKLLRTLVDNLPINVYIKDLESRKTMVNRSEVEYMNGLTEEEIIGKTDFELFPLSSAQSSLREDRQVLESGIPMISNETIDYRENGDINYLLTSKIPLKNNNNEIIGLLGISYDITKIKEAEHALAVSEEKYRKIFENIQDIYYRTDQEGIVTEISPSIEKYYGYKRENVLGKPATSFYFYKDDRDHIIAALTRDHAVTDFEVKLKSNTSELLYASVNARLIIEDGEVVGSEGSIRDISLRKLQENELTSLNTELKALNNHREKLLSVVGHDLRNPVAASLKLTELALMDLDSTSKEELVEYLSKVKEGLNNANELLEDLLRWAKNQFDSMDFNPVQICDIQLQVHTCLARLRPMAEAKNLELTETIDEDLEVHADKDMLDTVIRNLVSNAIKFTSKGEVNISAHRRKKDTLFCISDTGKGISKEVILQLFNKSSHYTSYGTSGEKGTGLGLELCRDFVEKHHGKIWVESREGCGSKFYFTIPV